MKKLVDMSKMPQMPFFDKQFELDATDFLSKYQKGKLDGHSVPTVKHLEILNDNITLEEVKGAIKGLKAGKSPGIDSIPAEFIKISADFLAPHITTVFNFVLASGSYPTSWAEGLRVAIPKGADDVRPITIEPIMGKLFQTVIDTRLTFLNEITARTDTFNGGFRKGCQTADNMFVLLTCIQKQLATGNSLYVAFVDFKKAFNYVNRKLLFYKIIKSGIHGRTINVLIDMYTKTKSAVKINGKVQGWIHDHFGTNQGGPMSPNMFREMLADLSQYLRQTHGITLSDSMILLHLLWADD
jgi:hypothetical protein